MTVVQYNKKTRLQILFMQRRFVRSAPLFT